MAFQQQSPAHYPPPPSMPGFAPVLAGVATNATIVGGVGPFVVNQAANAPANFQPKAQPDAVQLIKPPKAPEKPLVPYMRFSKKMWSVVRAENPDRQLWDIGKVIGQMWREAAPDEKQMYQAEYDGEKIAYDKSMREFHNSAPYQTYLANKARAKQQEKEQRERERAATQQQERIVQQQMPPPAGLPPSSSMHLQQRYGSQPPPPHGGRHHRGGSGGGHHRGSGESGVVIQPVEENDGGETQMSLRRVSQGRFERNHRLVAELFGTQLVPDNRSIVTQARIDMLRRQARSLDDHQKKLEAEITALESKFESKKRTIEESGEGFMLLMKQVCTERPTIDDEQFETMVVEQSQKLKDAYELYAKRDNHVGIVRPAQPYAAVVGDQNGAAASLPVAAGVVSSASRPPAPSPTTVTGVVVPSDATLSGGVVNGCVVNGDTESSFPSAAVPPAPMAVVAAREPITVTPSVDEVTTDAPLARSTTSSSPPSEVGRASVTAESASATSNVANETSEDAPPLCVMDTPHLPTAVVGGLSDGVDAAQPQGSLTASPVTNMDTDSGTHPPTGPASTTTTTAVDVEGEQKKEEGDNGTEPCDQGERQEMKDKEEEHRMEEDEIHDDVEGNAPAGQDNANSSSVVEDATVPTPLQ